MKQKNIFKILILSLCLALILCFTACKQDTTTNKDDDTTATSSGQTSDAGGQLTASGIELEEDVFDDSDIQSNPSKNSSTGNTSIGNSSDKNESIDNTSGGTSSGEAPDEDDSSSQEGVIVDDGVIELPIDRFN